MFGERPDHLHAAGEAHSLIEVIQIQRRPTRSTPDMCDRVPAIIQKIVAQSPATERQALDVGLLKTHSFSAPSPCSVDEALWSVPVHFENLPEEEKRQVVAVGRPSLSE